MAGNNCEEVEIEVYEEYIKHFTPVFLFDFNGNAEFCTTNNLSCYQCKAERICGDLTAYPTIPKYYLEQEKKRNPDFFI